MSVRIRGDALRIQLAVRGMSQADLARSAGLSEATVSAAARGLPVASHTLRRIGEALAAQPVLAVEGLIDDGHKAIERP